jgi:hypothetical protein
MTTKQIIVAIGFGATKTGKHCSPKCRMATQISPMDELTARLEVLMRRTAEACDQGKGDVPQLLKQFRKELQLLVAQYGQLAVNAALDGEISDGAWPSVSLH